MRGKSLMNMHISVEEVENLDEFVRNGSYGSRSDAEILARNISLLIDDYISESPNLRIEKMEGGKNGSKFWITMQISTEEMEDCDELPVEDFLESDMMHAQIPSEGYCVY